MGIHLQRRSTLRLLPKTIKNSLCFQERERGGLFLNIKITTQESHYLGSCIGTSEGLESFLQNYIIGWTKDVCALAEIARFEPQAAYAAFLYGTSKRWTFVSRTTSYIVFHIFPLVQTKMDSPPIKQPSVGRMFSPLTYLII